MSTIRYLIMTICALVLMGMLHGCGHAIEYVQRPCDERPPSMYTAHTKALGESPDVFIWVRAAIAELLERDAYEREMSQALYNCITR